MRNGTAVQEYTSLSEWDFSLGKWHRSKDKKQTPGSDFASFMINKKWWLEEQFNVHMMRFQQVEDFSFSNNLTSIVPGWFGAKRDYIQGRRGGKATRATETGTFLPAPGHPVRGSDPLNGLLHHGDHHQVVTEE